MPDIALILLAAGASARLGRPKQLLAYRGRSLLRHAAEAAVESVCRPVLVVLGAEAERMRPELDGLPVQIFENVDWAQGMASSLCAGLRAVPEDAEGAVVILCDQPLLTGDVIDALVTACGESRAPVAASEYGGTLGVPALFGRALFPELAALTGAEGAKQVILRHAADAARVPFPGGLVDIDTPDDLANLTPRPTPSGSFLATSPCQGDEGGEQGG